MTKLSGDMTISDGRATTLSSVMTPPDGRATALTWDVAMPDDRATAFTRDVVMADGRATTLTHQVAMSDERAILYPPFLLGRTSSGDAWNTAGLWTKSILNRLTSRISRDAGSAPEAQEKLGEVGAGRCT